MMFKLVMFNVFIIVNDEHAFLQEEDKFNKFNFIFITFNHINKNDNIYEFGTL